jgi:hypothetical protein
MGQQRHNRNLCWPSYFQRSFAGRHALCKRNHGQENFAESRPDLLPRFGIERTAQLTSMISSVGFHYVTKSGISWGMADLTVPPIKAQLAQS